MGGASTLSSSTLRGQSCSAELEGGQCLDGWGWSWGWGSWRLLLPLLRTSPSPSVPASLQTRRPTQPPLLGKLGRCMTQVTREHRSGARRLFKNSSPSVSGRWEGSSGRGGSMAALGNDQWAGFVSLTVLNKACSKLMEIIVALCAADDCTHPDPPKNSQHH